ncbi:MAG: RNA polymerase sporulation sigma factor SigE [Oscillospiraceae bacterium]|nr:RNA polymerase sporulation sigma factor SigE [Oscillospiraceae bacterium]
MSIMMKAKLLFLEILKKYFGKSVYYINGPENLPPPLGKEEEEKVFLMLEEGKPGAKNILIEHNLRLVVYIARKFESTGIGIEDLISIGTIGLIKAVNTFVASKGIKLATYASRCIENEILMFIRKTQPQKNEVSIDEPLNVDWDGNELLLSDVLGTENDIVNKGIEQDAEKTVLNEAVDRLSDREHKIMVLRFGLKGEKEHTQKEVADMIGISQSYISRLEKKIIAKLKRELEKTAMF